MKYLKAPTVPFHLPHVHQQGELFPMSSGSIRYERSSNYMRVLYKVKLFFVNYNNIDDPVHLY